MDGDITKLELVVANEATNDVDNDYVPVGGTEFTLDETQVGELVFYSQLKTQLL